jgi:large subunit ribosomal protein L25
LGEEKMKLATEARSETGKGAARRARAAGKIPAVFYGPKSKPVSVAIAPKAFTAALSTPHRRNALIELDLAGQSHFAMIKELQVHPVTRKVLHVDFYEVALDQKVSTHVPFVADGRAKGVIAGGELNVIYRDLPVRAAPGYIPAVIHVDVTNMALGDYLRTKDLQLPEGVEVTLEPERSLVTCLEPRKRPTEEDEAAAAGGAAKPADAAAAATPAAKPSKPPPGK